MPLFPIWYMTGASKPIAGVPPEYVCAAMKFSVTASMPFSSGAATLVPPTPPDCVPPVAFVLETNRTDEFVSATAEMSGMARPGHGAFAATPAPFCHDGRATMFEHQLPPAAHVSSVLSVVGDEVEKSVVPPTPTTYGLSDG